MDFVGSIMLFSGNYPPQGYLVCNGQSISVQDYPLLARILGVDGNGMSKLPDLTPPQSNSADPNFMKYIICAEGPYPCKGC